MRIIEKKLFKNTLAKVMAVTMAVTMVPAPVNVSAEENNFTKNEFIGGEDSGISMQGDKAFITALKTHYKDGVCILDQDYTITGYTYLMGGTLAIDLNGHSINIKEDNALCSWGEKSSLTIKNTESTGNINRTGNTDENSSPVYVSAGGSLTLESGTIQNNDGYGVTVARDGKFYVKGGTIDSKYSAISGNNKDGDMNIYVSGNSTLKAKEGPAIYKPSGGDLFIGNNANAVNNGANSLTADTGHVSPALTGGVSVRMGDIKISGGTFTSNIESEQKKNCPATSYNKQNAAFPDTFFAMGGTYKAATVESKSVEGATNDLNVEIAGGEFICNNNKGSAVAIYDFGKETQNMDITVTGGDFTKSSEGTTNVEFENNDNDNTSEKRGAFNVLKLQDSNLVLDENQGRAIKVFNIQGGNFTEPKSINNDSYIRNLFGENGIKEDGNTKYCYKEIENTITVGVHNPEEVPATDNNIAYTECNNCGKCYRDNEVIAEENTKLYGLSLKKDSNNFTALFDGTAETARYGYYQGASFVIKPNDGYSFGSVKPAVTPNLTGLSCTVSDKAADGSYTCTVATSAAITYQDAVLTVNASGVAANQYSVRTDLSNASNADVEITKNGTVFGENDKVTVNDTLTIKVTPKKGYKLGTPSVTAAGSQNCTISSPVANGGGYEYTVKGFKGNCNIAVTANAELVKYTISLDRKGLAETDADVKFVINGKNSESASVSMFDKVQLVITPKAGRVFYSAPVVKSDGKSVAGTAVAEEGSYKYTIHSFTGDTVVTTSGTAKAASHKVTLAGTVKLVNATASLDFKEVTGNGTAKIIITPADGYKITSNIKDIKAVLKTGSICTVSEAEAGANGTFIITLSGIKSDIEITSVTAETAIAKIVEAGTDTSVNVNEANLSNTFNTSEATAEEKKEIENNQKAILEEVKSVMGSATTSSVIFFNGAETLGEEAKKALVAELKAAVASGTVALSIEVTEQVIDGSIQTTVTAGKVYPLDISLFAQVIGVENVKQKMDSTGKGKIKIQMSVPSDIPVKGTDVKRTYYILRFHDGSSKPETILCKEKNGKLEFEIRLPQSHWL